MAKGAGLGDVLGLVGWLGGLEGEGTAQSVGERTTSSVVQTISLVIIIDALAAIWTACTGTRLKSSLRIVPVACSDSGSAPVTLATSTKKVSSASLSVSRSEEHTSELQSLMRISYAVFCLKKK